MTEALGATMDELFFSRRVARVSAQIFADNTASLKMVERLGFVREGYLKDAILDYTDKLHDLCLSSISLEEYEAKKNRY